MKTTAKTIYNFNAGPSVLPQEVFEQAAEGVKNLDGSGLSILEIGHRGKAFGAILEEAKSNIRELLQIPDTHEILFVQGGASEQFAWVPLNFLNEGKIGNYVNTGAWAKKALQEAQRVGATHVAADTSKTKPAAIPALDSIQLSENAAYLHVTSNETIAGSQWKELPKVQAPLIVDMSSDILSRPMRVADTDLIYAGAQKNLGPAGTTLVIIKKDFAARPTPANLPTILRYQTHLENNSLYNTPPCFAIYVVMLVTRWLKAQGGLVAIEKLNRQKAQKIYDAIDAGNFYQGLAAKNDRSIMNVTFKLPTEALDEKFVKEAQAEGLVGLKGHRSVGSIRASLYNAMTEAGAEALAQFMSTFQKNNG